MEKKNFVKPEIEFISLEFEDIITASGGYCEDTHGHNCDPWNDRPGRGGHHGR